jgi:hypothetical protein
MGKYMQGQVHIRQGTHNSGAYLRWKFWQKNIYCTYFKDSFLSK